MPHKTSTTHIHTKYIASDILTRMLHIRQVNSKIGVWAILSIEGMAISLESEV